MKQRSSGQYYGSYKKELDLNGILINDCDYVLDSTPWHYHEHPYFMILLTGQVMDVNKKRSYPLIPGTVLFQNWEDPHYNYNHSARASGFHVEIDQEWLKKLDMNRHLLAGNQIFDHPKIYSQFMSLYLDFYQEDHYRNESLKTGMLGILTELDDRSFHDDKFIPEWVPKLHTMIRELDHSFLNLEYLSAELGIHPVYLSRIFSRYFKMSFGKYIRNIKLNKSLSYLLDESFSLSEVAYIGGFSDQSHFIRCFKQEYKMTPKQFQLRMAS